MYPEVINLLYQNMVYRLDSRVKKLVETDGIPGSVTVWAHKNNRSFAVTYTGPIGIGPDNWMEDERLFVRLVTDCLYNIHSLDNKLKNSNI
jgi:hypothetical protein